MRLATLSLSHSDFQAWVAKVKGAAQPLDQASYAQRAKPTIKHPGTYYSAVQARLFLDIVDKYEGMNKANKAKRRQTQLDETGERSTQHPSLLAEER